MKLKSLISGFLVEFMECSRGLFRTAEGGGPVQYPVVIELAVIPTRR